MRSVFFFGSVGGIGNLCPYLFYVLFKYWFWRWEVKLEVSGVGHLLHCSVFSIANHLKCTLASHILVFFCHIIALLKIVVKPAACLREVLLLSFENQRTVLNVEINVIWSLIRQEDRLCYSIDFVLVQSYCLLFWMAFYFPIASFNPPPHYQTA